MRKKVFESMARGAAALLLVSTTAEAALNIATQATQNMSCSGGVCTATAQKAYLNVTDLTNMLAAGDLKIVSGAGAEDIHLQAPFSWTSTSRLTLDAQRSIEFEKPVTVAGTGALTLITNDGDTGGDYWFDAGASVSFWDTSSSLIINGQTFTLVQDIKTLASDIAANPSGNFALANDYDASADGTYAEVPVQSTLFGTLEGLGNEIEHLSINTSGRCAALITQIGVSGNFDAVARDIRLTDAGIVLLGNDGGGVGTLACAADSTISHVWADGHIIAADEVDAGGILGGLGNEGVVLNSGAAVQIDVGRRSDAGGLVGFSWGEVAFSHAEADVSAGQRGRAGGLVGMALSGTGLVVVRQSFATGSVSVADTGAGSASAGGLIGSAGGQIFDSYATGSVTGGSSGWVGGLLGFSGAHTWTSYSTGQINDGAHGASGGFIGKMGKNGNSRDQDDFWDVETSGSNQPCGEPQRCNGIVGLADAQLKAALPAGFDPMIWGQNKKINNGYPYLLANPPPKDAPAKVRAKSPARAAAIVKRQAATPTMK